MKSRMEALRRAARFLLDSADPEAGQYEGQSPVEDCALSALEAAYRGDADVDDYLDALDSVEWKHRFDTPLQFFEDWQREVRDRGLVGEELVTFLAGYQKGGARGSS